MPDLPDWNGLHSVTVAALIRPYTRFGDVVVDLDDHPSVIETARYLSRALARVVTGRHGLCVRQVPPPVGQWPAAPLGGRAPTSSSPPRPAPRCTPSTCTP